MPHARDRRRRRRAGGGLAAAALAAAAAAACAQPPDVDTPGAAVDAGARFAEVVLAYTQGGAVQVCGEGLPVCDAGDPAPCGPAEVLGPPDSATFVLEAGGRIDLGFRCSPVVERGEQGSPDLKIWAQVPAGGGAVVEVSTDGATYEVWTELLESDQELDLATIAWPYAQFIRIADGGSGGIAIDAVEALH